MQVSVTVSFPRSAGRFPSDSRSRPKKVSFMRCAIAMRRRSAKLPSVGLLTCDMASCPVAG